MVYLDSSSLVVRFLSTSVYPSDSCRSQLLQFFFLSLAKICLYIKTKHVYVLLYRWFKLLNHPLKNKICISHRKCRKSNECFGRLLNEMSSQSFIFLKNIFPSQLIVSDIATRKLEYRRSNSQPENIHH